MRERITEGSLSDSLPSRAPADQGAGSMDLGSMDQGFISPSIPTSSNAPGERATVDERSITSRQMRCPADGTFMRRSTCPGSTLWLCHCGQVRSSDPATNFGLMLLGFTSKAARP